MWRIETGFQNRLSEKEFWMRCYVFIIYEASSVDNGISLLWYGTVRISQWRAQT